MRLQPDCKLIKNYAAGTGRRPWVISAANTSYDYVNRKATLQNLGVYVKEVACKNGTDNLPSQHFDSTLIFAGRLSIRSILSTLRKAGIKSLMVEGGASVIASFIEAASSESDSTTVDKIIITIAPTLVGADGVGYSSELSGKVCVMFYGFLLGLTKSSDTQLRDCTQ